MYDEDGFCASCGAIFDSDLLAAVDYLDPPTSPDLTLPGTDSSPQDVSKTDPIRTAAVGVGDLGGFDERTDIAPPPLDDLPPMATPPAPGPRPAPPPVVFEKAVDQFQSFLEENTGTMDSVLFEEEAGPHRADRQAMVQPQVVLRTKPGAARADLSPFEQHVLQFLDGKRPLARLRKKAGLAFADLKVAIGMLADRGVIEVVGAYKPDVRALLEDDDLADSGPHPTIPARPPPPAPPRPAPTRPAPPPLPGQGARAAAMPLPGHGTVPPRTRTPAPVPAPAPAPVPAPHPAPSAGDAHARAQANQLLERALSEQRAGKRQAALAYLHMAAELLPGDPRIDELRRALLAR